MNVSVVKVILGCILYSELLYNFQLQWNLMYIKHL